MGKKLSKDNIFSDENWKGTREEALTHVAFAVVGEFEALLKDKGIKIPNEEREGKKDEACIFGSDYYRLEEEVKGILKHYELL